AIAGAARAWRRLTWRHWAWTIAIPLLVALSMPLQVFPSNRYWAFWQMLYNIPWYVFIALLFLGAIVAAEASSARTATAAWRYVGSMIVASAICIGVAGMFHDRFPKPPRTVEMGQTLKPRTDFSPLERERRDRTHVMLRALTPL